MPKKSIRKKSRLSPVARTILKRRLSGYGWNDRHTDRPIVHEQEFILKGQANIGPPPQDSEKIMSEMVDSWYRYPVFNHFVSLIQQSRYHYDNPTPEEMNMLIVWIKKEFPVDQLPWYARFMNRIKQCVA